MTTKQWIIIWMVCSYVAVGVAEFKDHEWRMGIVAWLLAVVQALIYLWR